MQGKSKIIIIGPGAIGILFAFHLRRNGADVILADHDPNGTGRMTSRAIGVSSYKDDGNAIRETIVKCTSDPSALDITNPNYVIFAVKAYDTQKAVEEWSSIVGRDTCVVSLQNGLGNLEILERSFGKDRLIAAVTSEASTLLGKGRVYHAAKGQTVLASLNQSSLPFTRGFARLLQCAGLESSIQENVQDMIWGKLVINSAINPLSAITNFTNGELLAHEGTQKLLCQIAQETYSVARQGLSIRPSIGESEDGGVNPSKVVLKAAETTSRNKSSMLQDLERGKRTEIEFLSGAIYRAARKVSMNAPLNEAMYMLVKSLEEQRMSMSD
jgi:2-dehydropantoate 2-reductase